MTAFHALFRVEHKNACPYNTELEREQGQGRAWTRQKKKNVVCAARRAKPMLRGGPRPARNEKDTPANAPSHKAGPIQEDDQGGQGGGEAAAAGGRGGVWRHGVCVERENF
jgi:hypothetical protein